MNKYLRRLFTAVVALFVILGLSSTIIMAVRANALNNDPRNARSLYHQLGAYLAVPFWPRTAMVMAKSEPVNDAFQIPAHLFQRSSVCSGHRLLLHQPDRRSRPGKPSRSMLLLNGEADSLIWQRAKAMLYRHYESGASIETSIDPKLQQVAYDQLGTRDGAAVAIEVNTGRILAMVSTPSYDPNKLATHDTKAASQAYNELSAGQNSPSNQPRHLAAVPTQGPRSRPSSPRLRWKPAIIRRTRRFLRAPAIPCREPPHSCRTTRHRPMASTGRSPARGRRMVVQYRVRPAWRETRREQGFDMATKLGFGSTITIDGTESTGTPMTATASISL